MLSMPRVSKLNTRAWQGRLIIGWNVQNCSVLIKYIKLVNFSVALTKSHHWCRHRGLDRLHLQISGVTTPKLPPPPTKDNSAQLPSLFHGWPPRSHMTHKTEAVAHFFAFDLQFSIRMCKAPAQAPRKESKSSWACLFTCCSSLLSSARFSLLL